MSSDDLYENLKSQNNLGYGLKENKKILIENLINLMNYSNNEGWFLPKSVIFPLNSNYRSTKTLSEMKTDPENDIRTRLTHTHTCTNLPDGDKHMTSNRCYPAHPIL